MRRLDFNNWRDNPNGESYLEGIRVTGSPDVQRRPAEPLANLGPKISQVEEGFARDHGWTSNRSTRVWGTNPDLAGTAQVNIPVAASTVDARRRYAVG
jgi:hypothetical protein